MRIRLIAVGRCRDSAISELVDRYIQRCPWPVVVEELAAQQSPTRDAEKLSRRLGATPFIALDERGELVSSQVFADRLDRWRQDGIKECAFVIGGADGLDRPLKTKANWSLALGRLTWPHLMVRVMLAEQIYRASCILAGHPYHRK